MNEKLRAPWAMYTSENESYLSGAGARGMVYNVPTLAIQYDPALPYPGDGRMWMIEGGFPLVADGVPMDGFVRVRRADSSGAPFVVRVSKLTEIPSHPERGPERRKMSALNVLSESFSDLRTYNGDDEAWRRGREAIRALRSDRRETPERRKDWPEGGR